MSMSRLQCSSRVSRQPRCISSCLVCVGILRRVSLCGLPKSISGFPLGLAGFISLAGGNMAEARSWPATGRKNTALCQRVTPSMRCQAAQPAILPYFLRCVVYSMHGIIHQLRTRPHASPKQKSHIAVTATSTPSPQPSLATSEDICIAHLRSMMEAARVSPLPLKALSMA